MRKYQQLCLVVLALASIFGLLLYRKQYVELRLTFENFGIFGNSEESHGCVVLNETLNNSLKFSYPLSAWISLQDDFYVYSAFWKGRGVSKAVGIGPKGRVPNFECHIWHDYRDTFFSNIGSFSYNEIKVQNSLFNVFEFSCDIGSSKVTGKPYMFVLNKNKEKYTIPISENGVEKKGSIAMCVYPDYVGISKTFIIEFIAYHQTVGFTKFIIYDKLHYGILLKIKGLVNALNWIESFDILPWHFPLGVNDASAKAALDLDCIHRVSSASLLTVIHLDDYIVPKFHNNIKYILTGTESANLIPSYQTCCMEAKNDRSSKKWWPLTMRITLCATSSQNRSVLMNPGPVILNTLSVAQILVIKSYKQCSSSQLSTAVYENSSKKFLNDMLRNKIILLWNSGTLF